MEKQCCTAAYLRGAFLGSGFVSDPRGDFHFEITVESEDLAGGLVDLLDRKGIRARVMQRRSSYMVYLKSGSAILEFLAFAGAHQSALAMENARVIKSVRNDVNRMTNAEIANQAKAANASVDQLYAIRVVLEAHGMENLPPALQDFIKLRVTYPDRHAQGAGRAREPALVEVRRVPPRTPHRADGEGGARLGGFSRKTETLGAGCASSRAAPGRTS